MFARRSDIPDSPSPKRSPRAGYRQNSITSHSDRLNTPNPSPAKAEPKLSQKRAKHYQARGFEALVVTGVNVFLSCAALIALAKLVPYQNSQSQSLEEITTEVQLVEQRVKVLRAKLPQMFDSGVSQKALLRNEGFIDRSEMAIKLIPNGGTNSETNGETKDGKTNETQMLPLLPSNTTAQRNLNR